MKIYLVDRDNGESYEDYHHQVVAAFTSFRSASQYLIDNGYVPCADYDWKTKEDTIRFLWQSEDGDGWINSSDAWIIEMDLQEG